jgi:hypothetical protein
MSPPVAFASLLQSFRSQSLHERDARQAYAAEVQAVSERLRQLLDDWVAMREVEPDNSRLANVAAVNRWELMRLAQEVEANTPPRGLGGVHRELFERAVDAARACQLLANGYRSHKSEAICDGQALFLDTVAALERLAKQIERD